MLHLTKDTKDIAFILTTLNDLTIKYDKLEAAHLQLKRQFELTIDQNQGAKKFDILNSLNKNYNPGELVFDIFLKSIILSNDDLELIFQKDYVDGMSEIIISGIRELTHKHGNKSIPFQCFTYKKNIIYIYDKLDADPSLYSWMIMDDLSLHKFIRHFDKNIMQLFLLWKDEACKSMDAEKYAHLYVRNMKRVVAGNFQKKNVRLLIKSAVWHEFARQN